MLIKYDYSKDQFTLKEKWCSLYADNPFLFPYSSFEYNQCIKKYKRFKPTTILQKDVFLVYSCGGKDLLFMPLSIHHKELIIFGDNISGAGNLDFVYSPDITDQHFLQALEELRELFPGYKLRLNKINERSRFYKFLHDNKEVLAKKYNMVEEVDRVCVKINFSKDYDDYYVSLSKNCKSNINKAYNKVKKTGVNMELTVVDGPVIYDKLLSEMMRIYTCRESKRKNRKVDFVAFFKHRYLSALTWAIQKLDSHYTFCLLFNGVIAAFMTGFRTNFNEIVFPIVAMNGEYAKYAPGKLMICESIKYLQRNTRIISLDLSRGDERYKMEMGGVKHYNYRFTFEL